MRRIPVDRRSLNLPPGRRVAGRRQRRVLQTCFRQSARSEKCTGLRTHQRLQNLLSTLCLSELCRENSDLCLLDCLNPPWWLYIFTLPFCPSNHHQFNGLYSRKIRMKPLTTSRQRTNCSFYLLYLKFNRTLSSPRVTYCSFVWCHLRLNISNKASVDICACSSIEHVLCETSKVHMSWFVSTSCLVVRVPFGPLCFALLIFSSVLFVVYLTFDLLFRLIVWKRRPCCICALFMAFWASDECNHI